MTSALSFTAVAAGGDHACGLRTDHTVTCWGDNEHGQIDAPAGAFSAVTAGDSHSCGVAADAVGLTDAPADSSSLAASSRRSVYGVSYLESISLNAAEFPRR